MAATLEQTIVVTGKQGVCERCGKETRTYDVIGEIRCGPCWGGVAGATQQGHKSAGELATEMEGIPPAASHSWVVRNWDDILWALRKAR